MSEHLVVGDGGPVAAFIMAQSAHSDDLRDVSELGARSGLVEIGAINLIGCRREIKAFTVENGEATGRQAGS
ncbi:hypothetical protein [Cryobacterium sp. TMT1-66-1]|uniref:hypothetical protein n=1 Tax=Cryobacterium sp. TMT1-66-1 TaxID=1259242 RepID=UPI00106C1444|nr:hypothetical protein [Cryobacterium sp. TMT1-66-1]TFD06326.1 hypothetical protein E3T29_10690 [Cryobacterium sp. TMT1-66-1]